MSQRWRGSGRQAFGAPSSSRPRKPCANPIFEQWITEWKEEAEAKDSKMKYVYAKALQSLRKYPLLLQSGKDCSILENFGSHMCKMIENRMVKENMVPSSPPPTGEGLSGLVDLTVEDPPASKKKPKARAPKAAAKGRDEGAASQSDGEGEAMVVNRRAPGKRGYVPAYRSGAYAILLALHKKENEPDYRGYMTKSELTQEAQSYCDASFNKPDTTKNSHYTAWTSMAGLVTKNLVFKRGNPSQFFLTPEGRELASKLASAESGPDPLAAVPLPRSGEEETSDVEYLSQDDNNEMAFVAKDVRLEPGNFEVVLYVDTAETAGKSRTQEVINELQRNGVTALVQKLSVGDFVWVCRETVSASANRNRLTMSTSTELVLPYVVERKRADDLASSIRDGRYREQKHRLTQTKLRVVYLVEAHGRGDWGLAEGALGQALCNTQIQAGFQVQETQGIKDTCAYLTFMTRRLKSIYENKVLIGRQKNDFDLEESIPNANQAYLMFFTDFNDFAVKKTHWTVKEMFARHLMRMKGLSVDKAFSIIQSYPTVHDLFQAYKRCTTEKEKEQLVSAMRFGNGDRKMGPAISKKLAYLYNNSKLF